MITIIKNSFGNKCLIIKNIYEFVLLISDIKVLANPYFFTLSTMLEDDYIITGQILNKEKIFMQVFRNNKNIAGFIDDYDDSLKSWISEVCKSS